MGNGYNPYLIYQPPPWRSELEHIKAEQMQLAMSALASNKVVESMKAETKETKDRRLLLCK